MNKLQRYFINENADDGQRFFIRNKNDRHHIINVMRNCVGDHIIITFQNQSVFECEITDINDEYIQIMPKVKLDIHTELPLYVTICSGLIKADKYEWMLQKATELGANEFWAVDMARSVVKLNQTKAMKKIDRWQKIVKEAAEQSYRLTIPSVKYMSNLKSVYDKINHYDYILVAYEEQAKQNERSHFRQLLQCFKPNDRVLMIFGPEGGLTESEIEMFKDNSHTVGLGPRILRAETAPLYALSAMSYENELLG